MSTLYLFCGKIASGKSTLASKLTTQHKAVLVSEDQWLSALYPDEIKSLEDYRRCSLRLRDVLGPHVISLLTHRTSVVLDFPANTKQQRKWLRNLFVASQSDHELYFLDVTDTVCKKRLTKRNALGQHAFQPSEADFDLFTSYFEPPMTDEGFNIIRSEA